MLCSFLRDVNSSALLSYPQFFTTSSSSLPCVKADDVVFVDDDVLAGDDGVIFIELFRASLDFWCILCTFIRSTHNERRIASTLLTMKPMSNAISIVPIIFCSFSSADDEDNKSATVYLAVVMINEI
jgi:hypothetical protein